MRAEVLLYIIVAAIFSYFLLGYVQQSEGEGDASVFGHTASIKADAKLHSTDINGQSILNISNTFGGDQVDIWKRSPLHQEFMDLIPNFMAMQDFVHDRIIDKAFQEKLIKQINTVESDFFSGKITQREIKEKLDEL